MTGAVEHSAFGSIPFPCLGISRTDLFGEPGMPPIIGESSMPSIVHMDIYGDIPIGSARLCGEVEMPPVIGDSHIPPSIRVETDSFGDASILSVIGEIGTGSVRRLSIIDHLGFGEIPIGSVRLFGVMEIPPAIGNTHTHGIGHTGFIGDIPIVSVRLVGEIPQPFASDGIESECFGEPEMPPAIRQMGNPQFDDLETGPVTGDMETPPAIGNIYCG